MVAVPAGEVAFAVVRRARSHRSLLAGDRGHPYDRLVDRGWPVMAASGAYIGVATVLAVVAVVAVHRASLTAALVADAAALVLVVAGGLGTGALSPDRGVSA
jgi:hypothetical protein